VELIYATSRGYPRAQAQVIERKTKMKPKDLKCPYLEATDAQEARGSGI
jgi:hypothetical protein